MNASDLENKAERCLREILLGDNDTACRKAALHKLVIHLADSFIDILERKLASFVVTGDMPQKIELPGFIFKNDFGDEETNAFPIGRQY